MEKEGYNCKQGRSILRTLLVLLHASSCRWPVAFHATIFTVGVKHHINLKSHSPACLKCNFIFSFNFYLTFFFHQIASEVELFWGYSAIAPDETVVGIKKGLKVFNWKPHAENGDCYCQRSIQRGRPSKRTKPERRTRTTVVLRVQTRRSPTPKRMVALHLTNSLSDVYAANIGQRVGCCIIKEIAWTV